MAATVTVSLKNSVNQKIYLKRKKVWAGGQIECSKEISPGNTSTFIQDSGQSEGAAGGVEYVWGPENKYKWVIAWSNSRNEIGKEYNKVYTQILLEDEEVDWDEIKRSLDKSGQSSQLVKVQISSEINTDPAEENASNVTATVAAGSPPR